MKRECVRLSSGLLCAVFCVLLSGMVPATAVAHELQLQGSSSVGGSATELRGRINGDLPFSVTGRFNDWVVVFDNVGFPVFVEDIRNLATGPYNRTRPVERLSSGETRVFLKAVGVPAELNGGRIELWSGSNAVTVDRDPIVLVR
ncbi:MAG: hypothetical protein RLZZ458_1584 [Planctomycetota bacterium]|jgi:hypothetical protein